MAGKYEQFGHYLVVDVIDESVNSRVSLAVKPDYHQYVALKQLGSSRLTHQGFQESFANEGWIAVHMDHPNIPRVVERGFDSNDVPFVSFEYISGISLQKAIDSLKQIEKTIPLSLSLYIFRELAVALQYVHTRHDIHHGSDQDQTDSGPKHIVHCDVNPKNIILGFDGSVNLIDFGIACTSVTPHPPESLTGTFNFMSPEQVKGLTVDKRSDIFSLSEVMYFALSGQPPFEAKTDLGIVERLRTGEYTPLERVNSQIPATLARTVHRGLNPAPEQRFQTMHDFSEEIENFKNISRIHYTTKQFSRWLTGTFASTYNEEQKKLSALPTLLVESEHVSIKNPMRLAVVENAISKTAIFNPSAKKTLHGVGELGMKPSPQHQQQRGLTDRDSDKVDSPENLISDNIAGSQPNKTIIKQTTSQSPEAGSQYPERTKVDDTATSPPGEMWDDGPTLLDDDVEDQVQRIISERKRSGKKESGEVTTVGVPITDFNPTADSTHRDGRKPDPGVAKRQNADVLKSNLRDYTAKRKAEIRKAADIAPGSRAPNTNEKKRTTSINFIWRIVLFAALFASIFLVVLFFVFIKPMMITPPDPSPVTHTAAIDTTVNSIESSRVIASQPPSHNTPSTQTAESTTPGSTSTETPPDLPSLKVDDGAMSRNNRLPQPITGAVIEDPIAAVDTKAQIENTETKAFNHISRSRREEKQQLRKVKRIREHQRRQASSQRARQRLRQQKLRAAQRSAAANASVGYLTVRSAPASELVLVDGRSTGRGTPITSSTPLRLKPGKHRITLVSSGHSYSFQVIIKDGEQTKLSRVLPVP